MKFNPNDYNDRATMHCKTKAELDNFIEYLNANGYANIIPPHNDKCYYGENLYYFNAPHHWSSVTYAKNNGYTILEWSDFMNPFTKASLKTGDIILRRNETTEIVNRELEMFIRKTGWNDFDGIRDDLRDEYNPQFDIIAVRRPYRKEDCRFDAFNTKRGTLIYDRERDEVEEMTLAEVCKLLGKNIKIIK